jgi:membrane peptidoglycan carboxypeptidase
MINAPTKYNPNRNPKLALERRNLVLVVWQVKNISVEDQAESIKGKLPVVTNYQRSRCQQWT